MYIHDHNCTSASQMIQKVGLYILFRNGSIFFIYNIMFWDVAATQQNFQTKYNNQKSLSGCYFALMMWLLEFETDTQLTSCGMAVKLSLAFV